MPSHPFSYSPFETLLILQSLTSQSSAPSTFDNISELLKSNKFVRDAPGFDIARFAPDAIRELYLGYMREEAKSRSVTARTGSVQNGYAEGGEEPGSKKRRLESPEIGTVEDAEKYRGWLPGLLGQLYVRYREGIVREIKEEEGRYKVLEAEVRKLEEEAEEQKERVNGAASGKAEPGPQDTNVLDSTVDGGRSLARDLSSTKPTQQALSPHRNDGTKKPGVHSDSSSVQPSVLTGTSPSAQQPVSSADDSTVNEPGVTPNQFPPSSRLPQGNAPYGTPVGLPMVNPASGTPSYLPQPVQIFPHPSPPRRPPPMQLAQSQSPSQVSDASPTHPFTLPPSAPPRSPVILPPPPGMPLPSGSPQRQPSGYQDAPGHRRTPSGPTPPQMQYYSPTQQHVRPVPSPAAYPSQAFPPSHGHQQPYSTHVSPYGNQQYPLQPLASRQLPPPNGPPQDPTNIPRHVMGTPQQQHPPYSNRGSPQGYVTGQAPPYSGTPYGQVQTQENTSQMYDWLASDRRETPRPPMLDTSFLSTPWKTPDRGYVPTDPGSPTRPEDVSPISERANSPLDISEYKSKMPGRRGRGGRRGGRARQASPKPDAGSRTRRDHRGSTASSAIADSTRSRSESLIPNQSDSHTGTKSHPTRRVKHEPPSTPGGVLVEDSNEADLSAFSKDNTPRITNRRKPPSALPDPSARLTSKRKRDVLDSADFDDSPPVTSTFPRPSITQNPNQVITNRNLTRTCLHLMNEVTAHKHASIFAKPLTERDAPGYKNIIYRPTDLKTIKAAIQAGSRAIASASSESIGTLGGGDAGSPPSATPSKNIILTLPKTVDVIPPKAIVNSAQLERELMRMFANAIMFNPNPTQERGFGPSFPLRRNIDCERLEQPSTTDDAISDDTVTEQSTAPLGYEKFDDGGILSNTREMFDDVEKAVREWRVAEQGTFREEEYGGFGSVRWSIASAMGGASKKMDSLVDRESVFDDRMDELAEGPGDDKRGSVVGLGVTGDEDWSATGTLTGRKRRRGAE